MKETKRKDKSRKNDEIKEEKLFVWPLLVNRGSSLV